MLYRLYTPPDFAQLYAIEEACFQPPFRFGRRYMRQLVESPDSATRIAEEGGQMGGFAIVEWAKDLEGVIAYIQTIEVASDRRGQGIGGELLRQCEQAAREAGAQSIWLHVSAQNAGAIRLYERNGYRCVGREEDYYARGHAALVYTKPLAAALAT